VSGPSTWTLDQESLDRALDYWESKNPDDSSRPHIQMSLVELLADPLHWGTEDDDKGVFFGRVRDTNLGIMYAPNVEEMRVYVALIAEAPT
jgi:hypothetical protein